MRAAGLGVLPSHLFLASLWTRPGLRCSVIPLSLNAGLTGMAALGMLARCFAVVVSTLELEKRPDNKPSNGYFVFAVHLVFPTNAQLVAALSARNWTKIGKDNLCSSFSKRELSRMLGARARATENLAWACERKLRSSRKLLKPHVGT